MPRITKIAMAEVAFKEGTFCFKARALNYLATLPQSKGLSVRLPSLPTTPVLVLH